VGGIAHRIAGLAMKGGEKPAVFFLGTFGRDWTREEGEAGSIISLPVKPRQEGRSWFKKKSGGRVNWA